MHKLGGDIFTSAEMGKQLLLQNIQPSENGTHAPNAVVWENVTDELNLPALGISWIEFDPSNSNTVYFATGPTAILVC